MTTTTPKAESPQPVDTVMAEVRRVKIELLERFNYDLDAMAQDARERQGQSGHLVVDRSVKAAAPEA